MNWKAAALLFLMIFFTSVATTAAISLKVSNMSRLSTSESIILGTGLKPTGDPIGGPFPPATTV